MDSEHSEKKHKRGGKHGNRHKKPQSSTGCTTGSGPVAVNGVRHELVKILLPIDRSELSGEALRYTLALASKIGGHVTLFHATQEPDPTDAWNFLWGAKAVAASVGMDVDLCVLPKPPQECLVEQTKFFDLVVMATHGRHGLDRLVFGSVTECVLRNGDCPVLCLHDQERDFAMDVKHRILLCYDGSDCADHALHAMVSLIKPLRAEVTVLTVVRDGKASACSEDGVRSLKEAGLIWQQEIDSNAAHEEAFHMLGSATATIKDCLGKKFMVHTKAEMAEGRRTADVILQASHGYSMVVLGTHGREGPCRSLGGSVTEAVVRGSTVPVFVVGPHCR